MLSISQVEAVARFELGAGTDVLNLTQLLLAYLLRGYNNIFKVWPNNFFLWLFLFLILEFIKLVPNLASFQFAAVIR
jgi:hypothetical protein